MLAGRSRRTAWGRRYPLLLKRRSGLLVYERVLIRDDEAEWSARRRSYLLLVVLPYLPLLVYLVHSGGTVHVDT